MHISLIYFCYLILFHIIFIFITTLMMDDLTEIAFTILEAI